MIKHMMTTATIATLIAISSLASGQEPTPARSAIQITTGLSLAATPSAAGRDAAEKAKTGLKGRLPVAVVVFSCRDYFNEDLISSIAAVFDRPLISGTCSYSPITEQGNLADAGHSAGKGVAVMAITGDITATTVSAQVAPGKADENPFYAAGKSIAEQLTVALKDKAPGKLILTFGAQHAGQNEQYVKGLHSVLNQDLRIAGAHGDKVVVKGILRENTDVAILLSGKFKVSTATCGGNGNLVAKAEEATSTAIQNVNGKPAAMFIFDCGGRRGELAKDNLLGDELAAIRKKTGDIPLFGFYGGGEVGSKDNNSAPEGVGFSISCAVLSW